MPRSSAALLVFSLLTLGPKAQAQNPTAADVRSAYERLEFDQALSLAQNIIDNAEQYQPSALVEAHTLAGMIQISRGNRDGARGHFASALSMEPGLRLDPLFASPEVVEFFESVRQEVNARDPEQPRGVRYITLQDPRAAAAMRSMLLPGWGQLYKGERTRGVVLMSAWGLAAAGTIASHVIRENRRDRYLAETDPQRVPDRYDDFNRWHRLRNNLAIATLAIWVVSYVDALVFPGHRYEGVRSSRLNIDYAREAHAAGPRVTLRIPLGSTAQRMRGR